MSTPEWTCSCGEITFGFPDGEDNTMICSGCGKLLTHYIYDEEFQERCDREESWDDK